MGGVNIEIKNEGDKGLDTKQPKPLLVHRNALRIGFKWKGWEAERS